MGWTPGPGPTSGDDTYVGDATDETVDGGDGNDTLDGNGGNDTLTGGAGDDSLSGGAGDDVMNGGAGADEISTGVGVDQVNGGDDDDHIRISNTWENAGVQTIVGGDGNDLLEIMGGSNLLSGSTISQIENVYLGFAGYVTADLFTGIQNLWISQNGAMSLQAPGVIDLSAVNVPDTFEVVWNGNTIFSTHDASLQFQGSSGDDTLILPATSGVRLVANGYDGNDTLRGGADNDALYGGYGSNVVDGGDGNDEIVVLGNDTVTGGNGDDLVQIADGVVVLHADGGAGTDTLQIVPANIGGHVSGIGVGSTLTGFEQIVMVGGGGFITVAPGSLPSSGALLLSGVTLIQATPGVLDFTTLSVPSTFTYNLQNYTASFSYIGSSGDDTVLLPATGGPLLVQAHAGDGNDTLTASSGGSTIYGEGGNDSLTGAGGVDNLYGGDGVDSLAGNGGDDILVGQDGNDTLSGGNGDDIIDGGAGADILSGGAGNDTISYADDVLGVVLNLATSTVLGGDGDTISSFENADGGYGNDNITGTTAANSLSGGGGDDVLDGGNGADTLQGGSGNDTLQGGAGGDTMIGGSGDDTYFVDDQTDTVSEGLNGGNDAVLVSITGYTLGANVEIGAISGSIGLILNGNSLSNVLYGGSGGDALNGGGGDDTLQGGAGADTMTGGSGNDTYYVAQMGDAVAESSGQGTDATIVQMTAAYTLAANVEIGATFLGTGVNITGNGLDNQLYGNAGADTLNGASGNDFIQGAGGNDTMIGGTGNDAYFIEDAGDTITENSNEGSDAAIVFTASYTLAANVEVGARFLTTAYALTGNGLDNQLYGNNGDDTLNGAGGNDTIQGGGGNDTMIGGLGNDTFFVEQAGDVVTENSNEGNDAVLVLIGAYTLAANVEVGAAFLTTGVALTGNGLDNHLYGNNGADALSGAAGSDLLDGGFGADTLTGGTENDIFFFVAGQANGDTVTDFAGNGVSAGDQLQFAGYGTAAGGATFVQLDGTHWQINSADGLVHDTITLSNGAGVDVSDWMFV